MSYLYVCIKVQNAEICLSLIALYLRIKTNFESNDRPNGNNNHTLYRRGAKCG